MRYLFVVLTGMTVGFCTAKAEPLPWNYYVRLAPAGDAPALILGSEIRGEYNHETGVETNALTYALLPGGPAGSTRIHFETATGTTQLFTFGYGNWEYTENPPAGAVSSLFDLHYGFGNSPGATGTIQGRINAGGFFTTGTGNFTIGLDETREVEVEGQRARVHFGVRESESFSAIELTVTRLETPEPTTFALCGIGLAAAVISRFKRR